MEPLRPPVVVGGLGQARRLTASMMPFLNPRHRVRRRNPATYRGGITIKALAAVKSAALSHGIDASDLQAGSDPGIIRTELAMAASQGGLPESTADEILQAAAAATKRRTPDELAMQEARFNPGVADEAFIAQQRRLTARHTPEQMQRMRDWYSRNKYGAHVGAYDALLAEREEPSALEYPERAQWTFPSALEADDRPTQLALFNPLHKRRRNPIEPVAMLTPAIDRDNRPLWTWTTPWYSEDQPERDLTPGQFWTTRESALAERPAASRYVNDAMRRLSDDELYPVFRNPAAGDIEWQETTADEILESLGATPDEIAAGRDKARRWNDLYDQRERLKAQLAQTHTRAEQRPLRAQIRQTQDALDWGWRQEAQDRREDRQARKEEQTLKRLSWNPATPRRRRSYRRRSNPGVNPALVIALIALLGAGAWYWWTQMQRAAQLPGEAVA